MHSLRFVRSLLFALVLCALVTLVMPAPSFAQLSVSVTFAPPELPVYEQPVIPGPGYIWTPGYWQWSPDDGDFYWVPGTWVQPPEPEVLWTPGYWSWGGDAYNWNDGYWGPQLGSTAASTMDMATRVTAMKADIGRTGASSITVR